MERRRPMNEDQLDEIAQYIADKLPYLVDAETHAHHHQIFETWIERENRRAERWEKIRAQVGGWAVIGFLSGVGYAAWEAAKALWQIKMGAK